MHKILDEVWIFPEFRTYYPQKFTPANASNPIRYIREEIHLSEISNLKIEIETLQSELRRNVDEAISIIHDLKAENIMLKETANTK